MLRNVRPVISRQSQKKKKKKKADGASNVVEDSGEVSTKDSENDPVLVLNQRSSGPVVVDAVRGDVSDGRLDGKLPLGDVWARPCPENGPLPGGGVSRTERLPGDRSAQNEVTPLALNRHLVADHSHAIVKIPGVVD